MARQARCRLKQPGILAMQMGQGEALVGFGRPGRGLHCFAAICDRQGAFGSALAWCKGSHFLLCFRAILPKCEGWGGLVHIML